MMNSANNQANPMKRTNIAIILITAIVLCATAITSLAQAPPPPPSEKGTASNKAPGGGAPLDGGIYVVLALAAGFGAWKSHKALKKMRS
jgi:hypothetical protein